MLRRGGYITIVTFSDTGICAFCFTSSSARSRRQLAHYVVRRGLRAEPHAALRPRLDLVERAAARLRHARRPGCRQRGEGALVNAVGVARRDAAEEIGRRA
jgi:hypothetical protein